MTDCGPRQEFKFDVFISYRHADLDNAVAGYLQKALEHYHVPREIRKKCGKKNIRRVFRDEEELGVASDLFSEIEQNLKQSEFLVVICSPRILESKWCLREIETFIRYRGRENILPVLIEGEPDTAFPPVLMEEGEPLAADLRGKDKREVLRHARERMPRLAAPLLYCSYDELYQRHRVYKLRRALILAGLVALVSLVFGAVTLMQIREIRENYQAKLENQFRYLAQTASELQDSGDRDAALLVALEALPRSSEDTSRPYVAEARIALERALYTYSRDYRYQLRPLKQLEHREEIVTVTDRNEEENVLLTTDAGCIYIWDGGTCENICCQAYSGELKDAKLTGNHSAAVMTETGACCFDYENGQVLWEWEYPACTDGYCSGLGLFWAYDAESNRILCANQSLRLHDAGDYSGAELTPGHMFYLLDAATGQSRGWMPGTVMDLLGGDAYNTIYLSDDCFILSPGGAWTAVMLQTNVFDQTVVLTVFPTGGDEPVWEQTFTNESLMGNAIEEAVFLDGDYLAAVYLPESNMMLGQSGKSTAWELACWNMETGELRMRYEDTCLCLNNRASIERFDPADGNGSEAILSVTYDNVAVNLDWATGERLARIEDRSAIALNHFFSTGSELLVTADGYLFATRPTDDMVWDPVYSAYHYYIGLSRIERSEWLDGKAFFFAETGVYCYTPAEDESYTSLSDRPSRVDFTTDSSRLLVGGDNGQICFFNAEDFSMLWEDAYCSDYSNQTSALLDDRWAAYLTGDGTVVKFRSLQDESVQEVQLDGFTLDLAGNGDWCLRAAGSGAVLVWNDSSVTFREDNAQQMEDTALWLVDVEKGEVTARWSYQDIRGQFSEPFFLNCLMLRMDAPAASADARYVLFPCRFSGYLEDGSGQEDQAEVQRVLGWDLESGEALALPDEVQDGMAWKLTFGTSYFQQDGWISPTEPAAVFYNEDRNLLQVVNLASGEFLHELEVDSVASREVSFTPDGDHLIFQDPQKRVCVYDWKEGKYTMHGTTSESGYMQFTFHQDGQVLSAVYKAGGLTSESTMVYQRAGDGVYKPETCISFCGNCDGKTVVICGDQDSRLYHAYTLDELIAMAKEILDGRELTELERWNYLID